MTDPHRTLEQLERIPGLTWVDVRTPREHARGHIPDALSMPVLDDAEHARVGLCYAQEGAAAAKIVGLSIVGPRLAEVVARYAELAARGPVALYCWRGGMRSGLLGRLLADLGIPVWILRGGYREHRRRVMAVLEGALPPLIVLHGCTGSGKTLLLRKLAGALPVVDLEGLGQHRGSTFGAVGLAPQPAQLQFESELARAFAAAARDREPPFPVLVEGESPALGTLKLPPGLIRSMRSGWRLVVELPRPVRVQILVAEYAPSIQADPACLDRPLEYLAGRLPKAILARLRDARAAGELEVFCDLLLEHHYDALYRRWSRRGEQRDYRTITASSLPEAEEAVNAAVAEITALVREGRRGPFLPPPDPSKPVEVSPES